MKGLTRFITKGDLVMTELFVKGMIQGAALSIGSCIAMGVIGKLGGEGKKEKTKKTKEDKIVLVFG